LGLLSHLTLPKALTVTEAKKVRIIQCEDEIRDWGFPEQQLDAITETPSKRKH
jgi:hypothetical protein